MAKKGKLGQKENKNTIERPVRFKRYEYLFLIVCEDQKTEPEYFRKFVNALPEETLYLKTVGTGLDPKGVVERAIAERDALSLAAKKEVDYVWVVFDKDDADLNETRIARFNEAFAIAEKENFEVAYSNEVFELWLLLHLTEVDGGSPLPRQQVYNEIQNQIRLHTNYDQFTYVHGDSSILSVIATVGNEDVAIKRANVLELAHKGTLPIKANPCTRIHVLIQELRKWIEYYNYNP
jgi:hypothetical protein